MHRQLLFTAWLPSHRVMENHEDDSGWEGDVSGPSSQLHPCNLPVIQSVVSHFKNEVMITVVKVMYPTS